MARKLKGPANKLGENVVDLAAFRAAKRQDDPSEQTNTGMTSSLRRGLGNLTKTEIELIDDVASSIRLAMKVAYDEPLSSATFSKIGQHLERTGAALSKIDEISSNEALKKRAADLMGGVSNKFIASLYRTVAERQIQAGLNPERALSLARRAELSAK